MSQKQRILIELLTPPFLATLWLVVISWKAETISSVLLGFLPLLLFAYLFGIIPALLYTFAMERWFRSGLRVRFAWLCTAGLSALLGAAAGFLAAAFGAGIGFLIPSDCLHFLRIGAVVGLLIGVYVGRPQTTRAEQITGANRAPR
jgi:hypothetical protein